MESLLRTISHKSEAVGKAFEVREMSAKGQAALIDAKAEGVDGVRQAAIVCHHCVAEWQDESTDDIMANASFALILELSSVAIDLGGGQIPLKERAKKSKAARAKRSG